MEPTGEAAPLERVGQRHAPPLVSEQEGALRPLAPAQVTPRTVLVIIGIVLASAALLFLTWQLRTIVRWVVIALFLAVALNPAVNRLHRWRVPRAVAIGVVYVLMLLVITGLAALIVRPLVAQAQGLIDYATDLYTNRQGVIGSLQGLAEQYGLGGYIDTIQRQIATLPSRLSVAVGPLVSATLGIVSSVYASITILLLTFFLILDGERFAAAALGLLAPGQQPRFRRILDQSAGAVSGYISGNLTISLIAGVATFAVLTVLQMPYALILALVVALFDLVPLIGATLGAAAVSVVGLFVDPVKGGILIVFFLIYQQVENNVLQPLVYGRSVQLHPLAVFLAVLAGGEILGILGALLAIPIAEIIRILVVDWLDSRRRPGVVLGLEE